MTDRELWVKTVKTVGAMVGGTVVFLGSVSLVLLALGGRPTSASETRTGASGPAMTGETRPSSALPPSRAPRRGKEEPSASESRPGESI